MSRKTGLTLGKFAPFHKGHEYLIETALSQVDHLYVMVYATDLTPIPLQVRAGWIKTLYPQVEIIEAWNGPDGYGNTPEICQEQERYILSKLGGRPITHFFSSEFYGEHVSQALGAIDCRVDEARQKVPISGTQLRENSYEHRKYLSNIVYRDLITKICFMGAPSTGKSTLARELAERFFTKYMPEYGAEVWLKHQVDRRITLDVFETIAPEHVRREEELLLESRDYLFCDTSPITTYVFAKDYHGQAGPVLSRLAAQAEKAYDLFFLCEPDIPYHNTWDRSGDQKRHWFQKQIVDDLKERRIPFIPLRGDLEARMTRVSEILSSYAKYDNPLDVIKFQEEQR